jgi:hypothetical protein
MAPSHKVLRQEFSMSDKPRRRLFRFSLRTLLILITLLCCWLAWESSVVRQRKALLAEMEASRAFSVSPANTPWMVNPLTKPSDYPRRPTISWLRRRLDDEAIAYVWYWDIPPHIDLDQLQRAFPEAQFSESQPFQLIVGATGELEVKAVSGRTQR